ncbi:hypothetical protein S2091_2848 [Solimicrobium silvestre]|uniref:Uncharacterized protein n=1 Tax=Solimicrobium silvestre TaxID=2099400 RepID=A0A2S9GXN1_9BURK|nr:hypothetical protein S2091_2848 [Solimicrobium silvestre]
MLIKNSIALDSFIFDCADFIEEVTIHLQDESNNAMVVSILFLYPSFLKGWRNDQSCKRGKK